MEKDARYRLPVVGTGPKHAETRARRVWLGRIAALPVDAEVDVLLDDGMIVRTTLRAGLDRMTGLAVVWVHGIPGPYAAGRVRPANGWWRTPGCSRQAPL